MLKFFLLVAGLGTVLYLATPSRLKIPTHNDAPGVSSVTNLTQPGVIEGAEERVTWVVEGERTEWAVVALHGFSATRQETAPLAEKVATALGANLFEARLTAHGLENDGLVHVAAEDWLHDAARALTIGSELGDKIVVLGTSTGATLATAMLEHPTMDRVDSLVMISPNFSPIDPASKWLTRPFGPLIARLMIGETTSWEPYNEGQARYWTTEYPSRTLVEAMRLVDLANAQLPTTTVQRWLMIYSPQDQVVSTRRHIACLCEYRFIAETAD